MTHPQYTSACRLAQLDHPPPLSLAQLQHAQAGCSDCLNHLMRQNDGLVHWVIRRYGSNLLSYDEALQAGRIGLWQALLHFDLARGTAFSTYAVVVIGRHIHREGQAYRRFWRPLPQVFPAPLPHLLEEAHRGLLIQAVPSWMAQLPPRLVHIVRCYYGLDGSPPQTLSAIAQTLGITCQRAYQLLQKAHHLLALPIHSWPIRLLLGRTSTQELRATLRAWYTFRRRGQATTWRPIR
jgi:RNA polymerase sigma factor (sigma-70 family)